MTTLRERLSALWARCGLADASDPVLRDLEARYGEPHRAYHTLAHVEACLRELDTVRVHATDPDAIELALWFHDAIYDTHARDNEERSAGLAREVLGVAGMPSERIERIAAMILATRHAAVPDGDDTCLLVDVDLSILGQDEDVFDRYEAEIRTEYAWVPDDAFRQGRAAVLRGFLDRSSIFATDVHRARLEARARANLRRSLARLG